MAQSPTLDFIVNSGLTVLGTAAVTSSTGNTETLQVNGGAAVAKNLIVGTDTEIGGNLIVRGSIPFLSITTGTFTNLTVTGLGTLNATTLGVSTATQLDVAARLLVGGLSQLNNVTLSNQTNSTSSTTGALTVAGGVGIEKDLYVGGRAYVSGAEVLTTASIDLSTLQTVTEKGSSTTVAISVLNTLSSTSSNSGALTVAGGVGVGGAVYAGQVYDDNNRVVTSVVATGSTYIGIVGLISTGTATSFGIVNLGVQTLTAGTDTAVSNNIGQIVIWNTSTLESVSSRGSTTTNAINIANTASSISIVTGALTVAGGVGIGGALYVTELYASTASYVDNSLILTTATIGNFAVSSIEAGTDTAVSTSTGAVLIWNTSTLQSITDRGAQTSNAIAISNTDSSTSSVTGALTVAGGVGIDQDLYVGGTIYGTLVGLGIISTATNIAGGTVGQVLYQTAPGQTDFYGPGTAGNVLVSNGAAAPSYNNTLTLTSTLSNTTTMAGNALQVVGGVGISGSLYVEGPAYFVNNVVFSGTSTSIFSSSTVYTDNFIDLHFPGGAGPGGVWTVDDGKDIGHIFHHYKDATGDEHGALIWHNLSDELRWYMGGVDYVGGSVVYDFSTATFGAFRTGTIQLEHTIAATSTTTGTLVVVGGVGIGGGIYVGGAGTFTNTISATSATFSGTLNVTGITTARILNATSATFSGTLGVTGTSVLTGLQASNIAASGTLGVTGTSILAGLTTVTNTTSATSTSTGALQVRGGVGIGGALYAQQTSYINGSQILTVATIGSFGVGTITAGTDTVVSTSTGAVLIWNTSTLQSITNRGNATTNQIAITNSTAATSTNTGALQVQGGVGISGNLHVGGTTSSFMGNVGIGTTTPTDLLDVSTNIDGLVRINVKNSSTSISNNVGSELNVLSDIGRVVFGMYGSGHTGTLFGLPQSNTAAFFTAAGQPASRFIMGTRTTASYHIATADLVRITVSSSGTVSILTSVSSESTTTGALQVVGGVGIGSNLHVGGTTSSFAGYVGIGTTTPIAPLTIAYNTTAVTASSLLTSDVIVISGQSTAPGVNIIAAGSSSGHRGVFKATRARGTLTNPLVPQLNDNVFSLLGAIYTTATTSAPATAGISFEVDGAVTDTAAPQRISFLTNTGTARTERLRISSSGTVTVFLNLNATSTNTGALQVVGGVGIGGALHVQETSFVNGSQILTAANLGSFGVSVITAGTDTAVTTSTGAVTVYNISTLQSVTDRGAATTNAVSITNTTSAVSTTTGALQVQGGVGVSGSVYVGNRVGFVNASNVSRVYQVYNAATDSLDTVFG